MIIVSTVYRFKTPFLDISLERKNLLSVIDKIKSSLSFDWISFQEEKKQVGDYYKISLLIDNSLWNIDLFYIKEIKEKYLPIFKMDIELSSVFLSSNIQKRKTVKFLTNIFECFDWLNEKEYLIDIDKNLFYNSWILRIKKYPHYDFSSISNIQNDFEIKWWLKLLENFIVSFSNSNYILTKENSSEYHKLHWIVLYFIYLVFIISQNIEKTKGVLTELNNINSDIYDGHIDLVKQRLAYVDNLNIINFKNYKEKLELFYKLF